MSPAIAIDQPRAVALDVLQAVLRQRMPLDDLLAGQRDLHALPPRDRAFVRALGLSPAEYRRRFRPVPAR